MSCFRAYGALRTRGGSRRESACALPSRAGASSRSDRPLTEGVREGLRVEECLEAVVVQGVARRRRSHPASPRPRAAGETSSAWSPCSSRRQDGSSSAPQAASASTARAWAAIRFMPKVYGFQPWMTRGQGALRGADRPRADLPARGAAARPGARRAPAASRKRDGWIVNRFVCPPRSWRSSETSPCACRS